MKIREIKFFPVKGQPIGTFLSTVMKSEDLYRLAKSDVLKIQKENNDHSLPYIGNQREINSSKIKKIVNYLGTENATFPNSIIIHLDKENIVGEVDFKDNIIKIVDSDTTFSILDGQHRLEGLHEARKNVDVVVSILYGLSEAQKTEVFDIINSEQTKVNSSMIVYKQVLSEYLTPRKFASNLSVLFATEEDSVWKDKIKIIGVKDSLSEEGTISLSAFYKPILKLIYNDDDYFSLRQQLEMNGNRPENLNLDTKEKHIFSVFYQKQQLDVVYKILSNYFEAFFDVLNNEYTDGRSLLKKTTGYNAMMMLFENLYKEGLERGDLSKDYFLSRIETLKDLDGTINTSNYKGSGDSSAKELYDIFISKIQSNEVSYT